MCTEGFAAGCLLLFFFFTNEDMWVLGREYHSEQADQTLQTHRQGL